MSGLSCPACGWRPAAAGAREPHRCPGCASALSFDLEGRAFPRDAIAARPAQMWRYREALPQFAAPVSLGEGVTPLVSLPMDWDGPRAVAKCESSLPSGSYKDRGAATLVSWLHERGIAEAVEDSSGNAGAALAAYTARAGIRLKVFCPESAAAGKLAQIEACGAQLVRVPGPRPRATEALLEYLAANPDTAYASHLWHPLFLEGVRTMAWEIAEQLEWTLPDWVLCPVGAGSILLGLWRGFGDLVAVGAAAGPVPRLVAVQAARRSAVVAAFESGAETVTPKPPGEPTIAEGIAVPAPVRDREVLAALRATDGAALRVTEAQIADGWRHLARAGFYVEPTAAVVWPALLDLHARQPLPQQATVVLILSGHGLKAGAI